MLPDVDSEGRTTSEAGTRRLKLWDPAKGTPARPVRKRRKSAHPNILAVGGRASAVLEGDMDPRESPQPEQIVDLLRIILQPATAPTNANGARPPKDADGQPPAAGPEPRKK